LGGDVLQSVVNDLLHNNLIQLPIIIGDPDFPILQYADDTLLIMQADEEQLLVLKEALHDFSKSTGLYVNYHKSFLLLINISDDQANSLAQVFGCNVQGMPFTYLGLPLGTTRPKIQDLMTLVDRLERRLVANSTFLAYGERLQLIRSCLSSMPIFFLCSLDIPPGIIKQLNRIIRHCLWSDRKSDSKGKSLAAWDMICKPREKGGLGILDFKKQNEALLMKHLHKFYNK
jgi:hypothetical protein